eukprot:226123_1
MIKRKLLQYSICPAGRSARFTLAVSTIGIAVIVVMFAFQSHFTAGSCFRRESVETEDSAELPRAANASLVPNVAHWIVRGGELRFWEYLSLKSIRKFANPEILFVHADRPESMRGRWWDAAVANLSVTLRPVPIQVDNIAGKKVQFSAHKSDFLRFLVLLYYGGLYIDSDVWLLKSLEPLRHYPMTLGREDDGYALPNAAILAHPQSRFLRRWFHRYVTDYRPGAWQYNSVQVSGDIAKKHPDEIHIEKTSWMRPNYVERHLIFKDKIDMSAKFMLHLWHKMDAVASDKTCGELNCTDTITPEALASKNDSTVLAAARSIYYD